MAAAVNEAKLFNEEAITSNTIVPNEITALYTEIAGIKDGIKKQQIQLNDV